MKQIPARAADIVDLAIEFSTLGEYGLEYPEESPSLECRSSAPACEQTDRGSGPTVREHRVKGRPARTSHPRIQTENPKATRVRYAHAGTSKRCAGSESAYGLPEALRPPRIKLSFN